MPWLFFALAAGAILIAFSTYSIGLATICLFAALGLIIAGALMLASARISRQAQNPVRMLDAGSMATLRRRGEPAAVPAEGDEVDGEAAAGEGRDDLPPRNDPPDPATRN